MHRYGGTPLSVRAPRARAAIVIALLGFALSARAQESAPASSEEPASEGSEAPPSPPPEEAPGQDAPESGETEASEDAPAEDGHQVESEADDEAVPSEKSRGHEGEEDVVPREGARAAESEADGQEPARGPSDAEADGSLTRTPEAAPSPSDAQPVVEVEVHGRSVTTGVDRSANAATVVDLERAKHESADLGTVLSRVEGINVQRVGGLGSQARFSLAGFDETQVRFFIDGVPLEFAGYPFGMQNVPVNFVERVDVFKGVVPIRLGADALGGAFELVTDRSTRGTRASASYEGGSFGIHRVNGGARYRDDESGFFVKTEAFLDKADNDYPIQVEVSDLTGARTKTQVHRFHDGYLAGGGNVEVGLVDRPWAKRLLLRAFATDYSKDIQHNAFMTVPYGEAREGGVSSGASLRYENYFDGLLVSAVGGYVFDRSDFFDDTECVYNWFGQCVREQRVPGEIGGEPSDLSLWNHTGYLRASIEWLAHPDHQLRFSTAPTYFDRTGDNRLKPAPDPASDPRAMLKWVNGLEYEADLLHGALENVAFVKSYVQSVKGEDQVGGVTVNRDARRAKWGAGNALRYNFLDWLFAKASYEYAVRLPDPLELFGSGSLIADNPELEPERSHNANLTLAMERLTGSAGTLDASLTGFFRDAEQMIVLLGFEEIFRFENVLDARVWGAEGSFTWVSPSEYVELGGNVTYQSLRNTSTEGPFGQFEGDRIPNRPYLWTNGRARLQKRAMAAPGDELSFTWYTRYVHDFLRKWDLGREDTRVPVPSQWTQGAVLSYVITRPGGQELAFSAEVQNITDQRVFDFFGVQLPGRAAYFKGTIVY